MGGRLEGKSALVIGAGSIGPGWGNGKATAVLFAREGARVACADINLDAAEETRALIEAEGGTAIALKCNATRSAEVADTVARTVEAFGGLHVLDNNVGIAEVGDVVELEEAVWDRVNAVNLKSMFLGMKHAIPAMLASGGGAIVNISSVASIRHIGVAYSVYSATKAAVNQLTSATAIDYAARGIRVNAVLPGLMKTPMVENSTGLASAYADGDVEEMWRRRDAQVPMGHMGDGWDVANAALFLASDDARYITGHALVVDGGLTQKYS
ncbi:SDR family NAD(P)-dependent oxidoreductase [Stappia sp.]|uniref:SDR family NAD(P)-dependent oxidoreductase n=1 Tax=Stappia sp. TaxID=1870903 RepID=UPI003A9A4141